jgi:hypothetical protein
MLMIALPVLATTALIALMLLTASLATVLQLVSNGHTVVDTLLQHCVSDGVVLSGTLCEIEADDCGASDCENGGMCQDGLGSFECLCPVGSGYSGER